MSLGENGRPRTHDGKRRREALWSATAKLSLFIAPGFEVLPRSYACGLALPCLHGSPPQMRRGVRQPTDGVVTSRGGNSTG